MRIREDKVRQERDEAKTNKHLSELKKELDTVEQVVMSQDKFGEK
jgi:hypothetical protein